MYELDSTAVGSNLITSDNDGLQGNAEIIQNIIGLAGTGNIVVEQVSMPGGGTVTVPAGSDIVLITGSDTTKTTFTGPADAPTVIFQGNGGVDVVIGGTAAGDSNSGVDRIVVGTDASDKIVITDGKDTQIVLGAGNDTAVGGTGDDTIVAGFGNATIDGGSGNNVVFMQGDVSDYVVVVSGTSHVVLTNTVTGVTTDITNVQYVRVDGSDALIFAQSTLEAGIADLYHAAFGRTADIGGLHYWFDRAEAGMNIAQIAANFAASSEFLNAGGSVSNSQFITDLYTGLFGRAPDAAGLAYWTNALATGGQTRAGVLANFAAIAGQNEGGILNTEAHIVGSVTIVPDIV